MLVDLKSSGAEALPQIPSSDMDATAAGTEAERLGTAIENTQVAKNKDAVPEEWTGAAADAASTEIQALGVKVKTLSEAFPTAGKALKDWDYQLRGIRGKISLLQHSWDTYLSEYNAAVADAGQQEVNDPTVDKESLISKAQSTLRTHQETLRGKYDGHISFLNETAQNTANTINEARRNIVSDEAGSRGRSGVGVALFGSDTPILSGAAQWADAQEKAPEIAEALKKRPLTAADVDAFNSKYGEYLDNPYYAVAIAQYVNVDDLNKAALAALQTGYDQKTGFLISSGYETFNRNLGSLMVMAAGGSNLSENMADTQKSFDMLSGALVGRNGERVEQTVQKNLSQLMEFGWQEYEHPKIGVNSSATMYGYDIFTQLTGAAARDNKSLVLGPGFYDRVDGKNKSVFADIVDWDHQHTGVTTTDYMAQHPSEYALFGLAGKEKLTPEQFKSVFDPVQSVLELSDRPDSLNVDDHQSILAQHEEARMRAVRSALNVDTSFDVDGSKMNMTRYLTGWRGNAAGGGAAYQDLGDALGDVVNDASQYGTETMKRPVADNYPLGLQDPQYVADQTAYNRWTIDETNRAKIAQNFMLGYQDGLDHSSWNDWGNKGEDNFGHSNSKMRSWMGSVVAPRVSELADLLTDTKGTGGNGNVIDETHKHAPLDLSNQDLKRMFSKTGLFTDLTHDQPTLISGDGTNDSDYEGGHRPAWSRINSEAWKDYRLELKQQVNAEYGTSWASTVARKTAGWQTLINGLDEAPVNAKLAEDNEMVARNKVIRGMIDYAVDRAPLEQPFPIGGADFDYGVKTGVDAFLDKYAPTDLSDADMARRIEQEKNTSAAVKDAVTDAFLARKGVLAGSDQTKAELDREFLSGNGAHLGLNSFAAEMPPLEKLTDDQREAYVRFLGGGITDDEINGKTSYVGDKTALGALQHEANQEIATGEEFLEDAKEHYSK